MNTKYFHECINKRQRNKEILCLNFNGVRMERVDQLKGNVKFSTLSKPRLRNAYVSRYGVQEADLNTT